MEESLTEMLIATQQRCISLNEEIKRHQKTLLEKDRDSGNWLHRWRKNYFLGSWPFYFFLEHLSIRSVIINKFRLLLGRILVEICF